MLACSPFLILTLATTCRLLSARKINLNRQFRAGIFQSRLNFSDLQFGTQLWFRRDTLRYSPARFLAEPVARTWNVLVSRIHRISVISCSLTRPGKREQNNSAFSLTNWKSGCSLLCSMLVDNCRHFLYLKYI